MKWMQGKRKWLVLLCAFMVLGTGMTVPASGSLKIRLDNGSKSSWTEGTQVPTVTVNYSEVNPEWSKEDVDDWVPGKKITGIIRVDGTFTRSDCTIYGGSLVSVKAEDGVTEIKVSYVPVAMLESPKEAGWSDNAKTKASWKKVPFASRYQVILYREGGIWVKSLTTSSTSVDLLQYMDGGYKYFYTVKAILKDSSEEDYLKEGEVTTSDDSVVQELGDTSGTWAEYQNGKKYRGEDGNYVVGQWKMVSGKWYYFNKDGYAVVGWQLIGDKWYYMGANAQMMTGWQQINGKWYYLNSDGDMAIGWIQPQPGKWYYLYSDGSLAVNTKVDGIYHIDASGLWVP
ncbi:N-acetylmuramoyl-L-alanine amidase family protein [Lacrimispora sp.]|uniref:N-acetylmuramoyl-L-alanine amidase family protein n=1 Tax=Lacrimispora sp. TaxID=2719234 RepID=UPI00285A872A|nr:N-acetylmuramoyl-L-alanine amidase family protein [Lacrimispora sp.]MDR7812832.1 N-acetylmuramoyl-L-alanine amidase family protein [Lacrimispora sp.]